MSEVCIKTTRMQLKELIDEVDRLRADITQLEYALKSLRNNNLSWEIDIKQDERKSVIVLYKSLVETRERLNYLLHSVCSIEY